MTLGFFQVLDNIYVYLSEKWLQFFFAKFKMEWFSFLHIGKPQLFGTFIKKKKLDK